MAVPKRVLRQNNSFKSLVKSRIKRTPSLEKTRKILNKIDRSLTEMVLEERRNY